MASTYRTGHQRTQVKLALTALGIPAGVLVTWLVGIAYAEIVDSQTGFLAIPCLMVMASGAWIATKERLKYFGIGLIIGAIIETAFFFYLFTTFFGDLDF